MRSCTISDSSNIRHVNYDHKKQKLQVAFVTGGVYEYSDITPEEFGKLISAESIGGYFATIKASLTGHKLM